MKSNSSTRNITIAVCVTLLAVLLTGCTTPEQGTTTKKSPQKNTENAVDNTALLEDPIQEKVSKDEVSNLIFSKGFNSPEYYALLKESALSAQQQVVQQELSTATDASACEKLSDAMGQRNCKNGFFYGKAIKEKQKSLCTSISDKGMEESCITEVIQESAREENNPALCNEIANKELKKQCSDIVGFEMARTSRDAKKCKTLSDEILQDMCKNEVELAIEEKKRQEEFEKQQQENFQ